MQYQMYLYRDGEAFEYTGGRTADTIKTWLDKKSGPPATPLAEVEAAEEFAGKAKVLTFKIIYFTTILFYYGCYKGSLCPLERKTERKKERKGVVVI